MQRDLVKKGQAYKLKKQKKNQQNDQQVVPKISKTILKLKFMQKNGPDQPEGQEQQKEQEIEEYKSEVESDNSSLEVENENWNIGVLWQNLKQKPENQIKITKIERIEKIEKKRKY